MVDPMKMVCGNCEHSGKNPGGPLECRRRPPAVLGAAAATPPTMAGGPPELTWLVKSVRPPVGPDETCGDFEPKAELAN